MRAKAQYDLDACKVQLGQLEAVVRMYDENLNRLHGSRELLAEMEARMFAVFAEQVKNVAPAQADAAAQEQRHVPYPATGLVKPSKSKRSTGKRLGRPPKNREEPKADGLSPSEAAEQ